MGPNSDWKAAMLEDFRQWLDMQPEDASLDTTSEGEECDLYTLFSELAALRQEVRLQSREQARLGRELGRAAERYDAASDVSRRRGEELSAFEARIRSDAQRACLVPLLDVRDALVRGRAAAAALSAPRGLWRRAPQGTAAVGEGYEMAIERLDRALRSFGIEVVQAVGRPFDARSMEAVRTRAIIGVADQAVVEELRCGFSWHGEMLRLAEVVVNRTGGADRPQGGE